MGALRAVVVGLGLPVMRRTASLEPPTNVVPTTTTLKAGASRTKHQAPLLNVKIIKICNPPPKKQKIIQQAKGVPLRVVLGS